jgi:PAS domain S-box-containing protein
MSDHEPGRDCRTEERAVHRDPRARPEGHGDGGGLRRRAEDRVLDILEVIGDAHFLLDRNWRFVYLSPNALGQARLPEAELLGQVLWEKYPELLGTPVEAHYRRAVAEGRMVRFETPGFLSGRWFEVYAAPLPDGLAVYSRDITDRKAVEQALRESEERLRRFFEAAFEGIAIHEDGVIVDANQSLADMFGYPLAELLGQHVLDLAAPESREEVRRRLLARDENLYETSGRRKDGSTFPLEVRGKSIAHRGRTARVAVLRDITRRKQAKEKLQEYAQRLRGLSRRLLEVQELERRHLARELHDEIGQVLTGLRLTLERNRRLPADELRASLAETQEFVRELTAQVRDLSLRLRPTMLDDFGLLAALLWHLERYTAQTGVRVSFEHRGLERRLAPEVETAGYRLIQEALTNVARHAGVAGCVVRVWLDQGVLYLQVEDEGRGFDAERVLSRGASSGLSGMQERVELLGGRFAVESAPGQGTRLLAELPVQVPAGKRREVP